jgi:hypothetical protein
MTLGKKAEILAIIIVFTVWIGIAVLYTKLLPKHGEVVYNCSIAEISPDFPLKVKEECRKLRMNQIK